MTDAAVKDAFISVDIDDNKNIFTSYPAEVDRHVSFLTAFEDEVMGAEHAFLGHECDKDLVDGHLGFGTYDLPKCFGVGNISSSLEYDSTLNVGEEAEREFFDNMLQGADARMLHECKVQQHTSNEHSPVPSENEEKTARSSTCIQDNGSLMEEKPKGTQSSSSRENGEEEGPLVIGKRMHKRPRRYIEESLVIKSRSASHRRCGSYNRASKVKPLVVKSPKQAAKQVSHKDSGGTHSVYDEEPFNGACIQVPFGLPVEEEQVEEEQVKETLPLLSIVPFHDSDNCNSNQSTISNERSDAECLSVSVKVRGNISKADGEVRANVQKGKRRRKHHIPWTQSEVMKLIEGISRLGVGRWSKIKKQLFSSSKHRTSVDLKDKWRNLVKASSQLKKKKKGLQGRKLLTHQAPEPVLRQVRELASSYS